MSGERLRKTTFLRVINGLLQRRRTDLLDGKEQRARHDWLGFCFQGPRCCRGGRA